MTLSNAHILLADDEPVLRMTLALVLQKHGARVTAVADGAQALEVVRREPVDLLLTDWHMPVMGGPAVLQTLVAEGRALPTVLCAGALGENDGPDLGELGVAAMLIKPFQPGELIATLERVLAAVPPRHA